MADACWLAGCREPPAATRAVLARSIALSPALARAPATPDSWAREMAMRGTLISAAALAAATTSQRRARTRQCSASQPIARRAISETEADVEVKNSLLTWTQLRDAALNTTGGQALKTLDERRASGLEPHSDAAVRHFNDSRKKPRITLYRDSAAWCPYCQKVWLLLEAKQVDYAIEKVNMRSYGDKPDSFLAKVPRGLLPAVSIDGQLMTESLDIMFTIENMFQTPERPMFPAPDDPTRNLAVSLLELERAIFGAWCNYLFRPEMPFIGGSKGDFEGALQQMDDELSKNKESPWFLPYENPTIVDMQYVSHMERMIASAMYYKGFDIRSTYKNIDLWLKAFEELPFYMATKSDFYTHCMDIPPQYGQPFPSDDEIALRVRANVDPKGTVFPLNVMYEPMTQKQADTPESEHCMEAAWSLIRNSEAVVKFACRAAGQGVGDWGRNSPYRSSLADPYAMPDMAVSKSVDALLRGVSLALLRGKPTLASEMRTLAEATVGKPEGGWGKAAVCLGYLRDRIGVPRDMQMPAAKILRACLGMVISDLRTSS